MASWATFEAQAPDLAAAGRRLLWIPGVGFGYLATIRAGGGPRLHPINVVIHDGALLAFFVPSPKLADLQRDDRVARHATGSAEENDEFLILGRARPAGGIDRAAAVASAGYSVGDDHVLMELDIDRAMWAEYASPPRWPPPRRGTAGPGPTAVRPTGWRASDRRRSTERLQVVVQPRGGEWRWEPGGREREEAEHHHQQQSGHVGGAGGPRGLARGQHGGVGPGHRLGGRRPGGAGQSSMNLTRRVIPQDSS